jgi:membrane protein
VKPPGLITRTRDDAARRWRAARQQHHWLDHVVIAWERYKDNRGNHFAGAITYFSFLALFPLILLAVSVLGFVLQHNAHLETTLFDKITANVPGPFGKTLKDSINAAINSRTSVGVIGLVGVALAGLGWVGNLRAAINAVWGVEPPKRKFLAAKVADLIVLAGLGLAALASIALTVVGTAFTDRILRVLGLDEVTGVYTLVKVLGIVLAVAGDMVVFAWLLVRLPRAQPPAAIVLRGALLAAVGFEILKVIGTYYIDRVTRSATAGIFGSIIGILVWIDLVSRYLLYCAAWTATAADRAAAAPSDEAAAVGLGHAQAGATATRPVRGLSPLGVAGSLFGAGAAVGAGAVAALAARRRRRGRARS